MTLSSNGWRIFVHPLFEQQFQQLQLKAARAIMRLGEDAINHSAVKMTQRLHDLMFSVIPRDPGDPMFRLGATLGDTNKNWFRAKLFGQYRLFYRYNSQMKIIVYVWVNGDESLRAYESKHDAYLTFKKMLASGYPPTDWQDLLEDSKEL